MGMFLFRKYCFGPSLASNPGASRPDIEKLVLDDLAADPAYANFGKVTGVAISKEFELS